MQTSGLKQQIANPAAYRKSRERYAQVAKFAAKQRLRKSFVEIRCCMHISQVGSVIDAYTRTTGKIAFSSSDGACGSD